jgi:hypothetical protein
MEEVLWNAWKDKYCSTDKKFLQPGLKEPSSSEFLKQLEVLDVTQLVDRQTKPPAQRPRREQKIDRDFLRQDLTLQTYQNKMITLISCEEKVHEAALQKYDGPIHLRFYKERLRTKRHAWYAYTHMELVKADTLRQAATNADVTYNHQVFYARLLFDQRFASGGEPILIIGFDDCIREDYNKTYSHPNILQSALDAMDEVSVMVHFPLKYSYFRNLRKAIQCLPYTVKQKLLPDSAYIGESRREISKPHLEIKSIEFPMNFEIDTICQKKASRKLLSCSSNLPFLITGPFGTGKTRVIAASAYHILKTEKCSRILIATHHRSTADEYPNKYFTANVLEENAISAVRLVSRQPRFARHITKGCDTLEPHELERYRIIITTFITSLYMKDPGLFTHIFIDEGAQAREPECVAAFRFATPDTKIVIAGDSKQVGPRTSVLGGDARNNGLAVSLLERLQSLYSQGTLQKITDSHKAVLFTNYRCHSAILHLPSSLFYNSTIMPKASDLPHPLWKYPLQFVCTSFYEKEQCKWASGKELYLAAKDEILTLKAIVQRCVSNWPSDQWGPKDLSSICVMTPTRLAVSVIYGHAIVLWSLVYVIDYPGYL